MDYLPSMMITFRITAEEKKNKINLFSCFEKTLLLFSSSYMTIFGMQINKEDIGNIIEYYSEQALFFYPKSIKKHG